LLGVIESAEEREASAGLSEQSEEG